MSIHDRKDQLIYSLAGLQATIWVGLFSVGFWDANPQIMYKGFWISFALATIGMFGIFLSAIACFYYAKYHENRQLHKTDAARARADRLAERWRIPWNHHWTFFIVGILGSISAFAFRFLGA